jgi:hypothetical protein
VTTSEILPSTSVLSADLASSPTSPCSSIETNLLRIHP